MIVEKSCYYAPVWALCTVPRIASHSLKLFMLRRGHVSSSFYQALEFDSFRWFLCSDTDSGSKKYNFRAASYFTVKQFCFLLRGFLLWSRIILKRCMLEWAFGQSRVSRIAPILTELFFLRKYLTCRAFGGLISKFQIISRPFYKEFAYLGVLTGRADYSKGVGKSSIVVFFTFVGFTLLCERRFQEVL